MEDWRIKDNKTICYNLFNKLYPYEAKETIITREIRRIRKRERCDERTATEIYKAELKAKLEARKCK